MAMAAFDPVREWTRDDEIDVWRVANLVEAYASSRQGLALAAHRRGYRVATQGSATSIELLECLGITLQDENREVARDLPANHVERARRAGIPDDVRRVTIQDITAWLASGWLPIVLVDAALVGDDRVPHWVVVIKVTPDEVTLHDPLAAAGGTRVARDVLIQHLGFGDTTCAVIVQGKEAPRLD
jgi:hypothetical protein